jgi:hypothetical protein
MGEGILGSGQFGGGAAGGPIVSPGMLLRRDTLWDNWSGLIVDTRGRGIGSGSPGGRLGACESPFI